MEALTFLIDIFLMLMVVYGVYKVDRSDDKETPQGLFAYHLSLRDKTVRKKNDLPR